MKKGWLQFAVALCLGWLIAAPASAGEPFLEFLRALQDKGYGELALVYIDSIAARPDLPVEMKQTLDLERSKSLRIAANEAYDDAQRQQRIAEADKLLNAFLKNNPDHPAGMPALITVVDATIFKAQMSLGQSRATRDAKEQDELRKQAREQFTQSLAELKKIQERVLARAKQFGPLPEGQKPSQERLDLDLVMLEARYKVAMCEYLSAQTYADPQDANRKKHLEQAAKGFDLIFQQNRGTRAGLLGHMWHGKTLEELGDKVTAMEVYDEVLVATPEEDASEGEADIFAQAQLFRTRLMIADGNLKDAIPEGEEWLRTHRFWEKTAPFQGVAIEVARARVDAANKATGNEQKRQLRDVMTLLLAISKVDSEYKHEALLLRRECNEKLGGAGTGSADEEIALGDAAMDSMEWAEATACYERAVEAATKAKDNKALDTANQRLVRVRYQLAVGLYTEKKYEEALKAAGEIVTAAPQDPAAVNASGLAVAAALDLYSATPEAERPAALERLERVAKYAIERYPDKQEADDARMALARVRLTQGEEDAGLEILKEVNPRSPRHGTAEQVVGQIYWRRYIAAKNALEQDPTQAEKMPELRKLARDHLKNSFESLKKASTDAETLADAQYLLAEVTLEDNDPAAAAPLFDGLVDAIKKSPPEKLTTQNLRPFNGAVRSRLALGEVDVAGNNVLALVDLGSDDEQVNVVLVGFTKLLNRAVQEAEAEITRLEDAKPADPDKLQKAIQNADATKKVVGQMVEKLSARKEMSLASLIYLGDTSAQLKMAERAREIYARVLTSIDKKETGDTDEVAQKAATRIRAQLISLLRTEGKYEEANKQADALIKTHPNALEPLMEKGRILQSWAEKDPKHYDECVNHWSRIRILLGRMRNKPPEFYEVLYNASFCLLQQAKATKDANKALQAEQMLKSTMTLSPKLNGPDTVEKYKSLLTKIAAVREQYEPKKPAVPNKKK